MHTTGNGGITSTKVLNFVLVAFQRVDLVTHQQNVVRILAHTKHCAGKAIGPLARMESTTPRALPVFRWRNKFMSSVAQENRKRLEEFDQKVLALYTENPKLINAELAKSFECRYD